MKETWKIAKWEVMRNLRNKQFIIGLLLTPIIMAMFSGVPRLLERWNQPAVSTYYVLDQAQGMQGLSEMSLGNVLLKSYAGSAETIEQSVREAEVAGYFSLHHGFFETGELELFFNERNNDGVGVIGSFLSNLLQQQRMQAANIAPEQLAHLTSQASVVAVAMESADVPGGEEVIVSMAFIALIFLLIFSSGTMLMQSALQERRDRMAEVVLSSIRPNQLMQGKVLGHFLLGVLQLVFWIALGLPAIIYFLDFPVWEAITQVNVPVLLFFGLFGYLLFSAIFVSLGATMEDLQSAGNAQGLVIMLPMLSFLFIGPVVSNPDGVIAQFASIFPFTSPALMIMRNAITRVPTWELILSAVVLIATTLLIIRLAAKVFRVGMLMYGKNASMGEIVKWMQYKDV